MLVIGIGNELRGDDGAGPAAVRELQHAGITVALSAGGIELLDLWRHAQAVVLVDAIRTGAPAGTIHRIDAGTGGVPLSAGAPVTHALGISDVIELGRALGRLPPRLIVYGIEATRFALGEGMSPYVAAALPQLRDAVRREIGQLG